MHLVIILTVLGLAWSLRLVPRQPMNNLKKCFAQSLFFFLVPGLLLLTTALAVLCMGSRGQMLGIPASPFSYFLALGFIGLAVALLLKLAYQAWLATKRSRSYPQQIVAQTKARILVTDFPYSAQIGFWQPELVVSQGLLDCFAPEHLEAVLAHEQAHYYYRDTFWFFWLDWLRSCTAWLPQTEALWQELLLLREMRADRWAAQQVDPLLLAESLLAIAQQIQQFTPVKDQEGFCAAFSCSAPSRIAERIDALLSDPEASTVPQGWHWQPFLIVFLPFLTVLFHH